MAIAHSLPWPCLFIVVLLEFAVASAASPTPAACAVTGVQPVALSRPLDFCGGEIGGFTCCDRAKDSALHLAFSSSSKEQDETSSSSCAAALVKRKLCAVCFPTAWIPADTSLPAPCAALADPTLLSSSTATEHLSRISAPALLSNSICFEKVAAVSYSGLVMAPNGSGRALVWNQQGEVRLASMPAAEETGAAMPMRVGDSPFIDLSSLVCYNEARGLRGLIGVVYHPHMDGRLFVSYTTTKSDDDYGAILVVKELLLGELGFEHTTVFWMDLPAAQAGFSSMLDHGGQIFFRPNDRSLYLVTGHGVSADLVSSNQSSLLGKILRLHVDHDMPGTDVEVFFSGLNIPRGCALDFSGSLYCADIDETQGKELVYLILDKNPASSATSVIVLKHPTTGMSPASIVWGLRYQGSAADASINERYLYAYHSAFWSAAMESTPSSGRYTPTTPTRMLLVCSRTTPMPCQDDGLIIVVSFAEGVILAADGVYRIVASSLCAAGPTPHHHSVGSLVGAVLGSVLGAMGTALLLAWVICKRLLQEDGKDSSPCLSIEGDCYCYCCNNNKCCIRCCC